MEFDISSLFIKSNDFIIHNISTTKAKNKKTVSLVSELFWINNIEDLTEF